MMARVGRYKKGERPLWYVRCLGPDTVPEHCFYSEDKVRERICSKCREKIKDMNLSPRLEKPVRTRETDE